MQSSQIHLVAILSAASAAFGARAEELVFECVVSPKSSLLGYSGDTQAPFPAVIVGNFNPSTNPGGAQTRPGPVGGSGNVPISCLGSLSIGGDVGAVPSGAFRLVVDTGNLTATIEDFTLDYFGGVPADIATHVLLSTTTFRTFSPDALFLGATQPPIAVGPAQINSLVISQTSDAQQALIVEQDVGTYQVTLQLDVSYALSMTAMGQTVRSGEPFSATLPLYGTIVVGEGGTASVSFELSHVQTLQQPLGIAPFAAFPIELPTVQPPDLIANLLLTGGASVIEVSMGLNGSLVANGSPEQREGDVDRDLVVGIDDLTLVLTAWGQAGVTDLDGNGTTDAIDLALVLHNWG